MMWIDWILRLLVSAPTPRTLRWTRLSVHSLEERTVPHGTEIHPVEPPTTVVVDEQATLNPYQQIGDRVWLDRNGNGFQDLNEPGVANVKMQLFEGDKLIGTTMSDPMGRYFFNKWNVHNGTLTDTSDDGLKENTTYQIRIVNDQPALSTLRPTLSNSGSGFDDEQRDSDAIAAGDGMTIELTTGDDDIYVHFDIGYMPAHSIGNLVWRDTNNNGKREAFEAGIPGVKLNLLDAETLQPIATTTSGIDGSYVFRGLAPDQYIVEIAKSNFEANGVLAGCSSSTGKPGAVTGPFEGSVTPNPDTSLIDGDDNGTTIDGAVRSLPVTVGARGAAETKVDFGFFHAATVAGKVFVDVDGDGRKDAEDTAGVANIRVRIMGAIGTLTTTTDANGNYSFGNLPAGTYAITRLDQPAGYRATTLSWGTKTIAANATAVLDFGQTKFVDLRIRQSASLGAANLGGSIVLTYRIANLGAMDATGVKLNLPLPGGFRYIATLTSGAVYDSTTGSVNVGTIAAGTETVIRIRVQAARVGAFAFRGTVSAFESESSVANNRSAVTLVSLPNMGGVVRSVVSALLFR